MKRAGGGTLGMLALSTLCLVLLPAFAEAQTPTSGPPAAPSPGSEGTYVVKKGDTLWGIAKSLLNDPFLWPQVWERNPFITNPNRIFPGDTLGVPGRAPAPPPVAEAPKPEAPPKEEAKEEVKKEVPKEAKEEVKEEVKAPAPTPPVPPVAPEAIVAPLRPVPPASEMAIACSPVLLNEAATVSVGIGNIVKSADNRLLLSQEDHVAVGLDREQIPKVGDRLAVIRTGQRVVHPYSKRALGRTLNTLGVLEVTDVYDRTARARIIYGCEAIHVGDRVGRLVLARFPEDKIAKPASRQVEGMIVDSPRSLEFLALQHLVYLDVGTGQGIESGDVFAIYRPNRPALNPGTGRRIPIPPDRLGEAVVIRVTDTTATAVLSATVKEIQAGDRVVLSRQIQP